jgi:hypothetical protein
MSKTDEPGKPCHRAPAAQEAQRIVIGKYFSPSLRRRLHQAMLLLSRRSFSS